MASITTLLLIAVASLGVNGASVADRRPADPEQGTELVFAFMVHRHGDRTPDKNNILAAFNFDNAKLQRMIDERGGYGQLTNVGKGTAYTLGEFIRRRYDGIIAPKYNDSEIYIRSTDVTRTKMTALSAMAAVFRPVGQRWRQDINWVPVPYTTTPGKDDYILSSPSSCKKFNTLFNAKQMSSDPSFSTKYEDVLSKLADIVGLEIGQMPIEVFVTWQDLTSLISMGYNIGKELSELYLELSEAFDASWAFMYDNEEMVTLAAGGLLNEFFVYAEKNMNGEPTQSVRVHSAHDINVYPFQAATKVKPQGRPKYGSLYSLELRKVVATGQYVVLPVYLADPHEGVEKYLQVKGCGGVLCDYELFKNITSTHRIDEDTLKEKCSQQ